MSKHSLVNNCNRPSAHFNGQAATEDDPDRSGDIDLARLTPEFDARLRQCSGKGIQVIKTQHVGDKFRLYITILDFLLLV
jgi:hypothetical protein